VTKFRVGERLGVPWLGWTCGQCRHCRQGRENLCDSPKFTGYTLNGGYAQYTVAQEHYTFHLPEGYPIAEAAPCCAPGSSATAPTAWPAKASSTWESTASGPRPTSPSRWRCTGASRFTPSPGQGI
jgi:D-arabinose 1-dehydrogenase-like Zn-dependent alcohol dehydrogenase